MKTILFNIICASMIWGHFLHAQDVSDDWMGRWINGIELSKDQSSYPKAIENYSTAIQALDSHQMAVRLNLINERGDIYFQLKDFPHAIKDFSYVINHPKADQDQVIDALWGRSKAYLASGQVQKFEEDASQLANLQFLDDPLTETKEYMVLKVDPYLLNDSKKKEQFIHTLLKRKRINSDKDVTFTPSGLIIIKKAKT